MPVGATNAGRGFQPTKVIETLMVVFGFVIGSGFDSQLEGFECKAPAEKIVSALLYGMGISVVTRFSLGGALHLDIEYEVNPNPLNPQQRRTAILFDLAFFLLYAMIMRYAAALRTETWFFGGQVAVFAVAFVWGVWAKWRAPEPFGKWGFWLWIDGVNFVVALAALCLLPSPPACLPARCWPLVVTGFAAACYVVLAVCDLRCLLSTAEEAVGRARKPPTVV